MLYAMWFSAEFLCSLALNFKSRIKHCLVHRIRDYTVNYKDDPTLSKTLECFYLYLCLLSPFVPSITNIFNQFAGL